MLRQRLHDYLNTHGLYERSIQFRRGEFVHRAGQTDGRLYYVVSGTLRTCVEIDGREQTIRFGYPGDFILALDSSITGQPTQLSTSALRKAELRVVKQTVYEAALNADAELHKLWNQLKDGLILGSMEREIDLLTADPAARYRRILARSPRVFQEIPARYIADYLRMSPETLSRIRTQQKLDARQDSGGELR